MSADPSTLGIQGQLLHLLQQFKDGVDVEGELSQNPGCEPEWKLTWSAHRLSCTRTIRASSTVLPRVGVEVTPMSRETVKEWDQFTCLPQVMVSLARATAQQRAGPAPLCYPGKVWGLQSATARKWWDKLI